MGLRGGVGEGGERVPMPESVVSGGEGGVRAVEERAAAICAVEGAGVDMFGNEDGMGWGGGTGGAGFYAGGGRGVDVMMNGCGGGHGR